MRERRERERAASGVPGGPAAARRAHPDWSAPGVLALQRAAGNRAVTVAVTSGAVSPRTGLVLQRCGGEQHAGCACLEEAPVQRVVDAAVQRDGPTDAPPAGDPAPARDPGDLTGTPFAAFDPQLQKVLQDKARFTWTEPTLAETLRKLNNASVAVIARVGAMITSTAPFLWEQIASMGGGGWITDNFGMRVAWKDAGAVAALLRDRPDFCRDNPITAKWYHGTTDAYRQIAPPAPPRSTSSQVAPPRSTSTSPARRGQGGFLPLQGPVQLRPVGVDGPRQGRHRRWRRRRQRGAGRRGRPLRDGPRPGQRNCARPTTTAPPTTPSSTTRTSTSRRSR